MTPLTQPHSGPQGGGRRMAPRPAVAGCGEDTHGRWPPSRPRPGGPTAQGVGVHVLVQILVGVQCRAGGRQEEEAQPVAGALEPLLGDRRDRHGMPLHDQKDGMLHVPESATAAWQADPRREPLRKPHAGQPPTSGESGEPVAAKSPAGATAHRGLAALAPPGPRLMIRAQAHLVAPRERGPRALGCCPHPRGLDGQPAPHRLGIPLRGLPQRLLRGEAPGPQGAPNGPDRQPKSGAARDQLTHRFAGPQGARQGPRLRAAVGHGANELGRWPALEPAATRPAPGPRLQGMPPPTGVSLQPGGPSLPTDAEEPTDLGLGAPLLLNGGDRFLAQDFLGFGRQVPRIADSCTHAQWITIAGHKSSISCSD